LKFYDLISEIEVKKGRLGGGARKIGDYGACTKRKTPLGLGSSLPSWGSFPCRTSWGDWGGKKRGGRALLDKAAGARHAELHCGETPGGGQ